jgi:hypothetical protein
MPLRTPFRLLIGFITISRNHLFRCVTFTQLTILHANIPFPHSLHNTLPIKPSHFETLAENLPCLAPAENSSVCLLPRTAV